MERFGGTEVALTGGASGIGRATVLRLVRAGVAVFVVERDKEARR